MADKQAACFNCRRGKMKCLNNMTGESLDCVGCIQRGLRCVRPTYHIGRNPGSRNKLSGLQRAICQVENALSNETSSSQQDREILDQFLCRISSRPSRPAVSSPMGSRRVPQPRMLLAQKSQNEAVKSAESPLLLIAQASEELAAASEQLQQQQQNHRVVGAADAIGHRGKATSQAAMPNYNSAFFGPFRPQLDTHPDLDPIALGLVDMTEAEQLFAFFYQHLSEMRWGLDPVVHSARFVHQRSFFLFTSVLAASTLFLPSASTLCKRLRLHCRKLANAIISQRLRSVEIVLAFMVNVPWLSPGSHWADDETWMYLSAASTIALDISLDKIILHPGTDKAIIEWSQTHQAECIDAQRALDMDGFSNVDVTSEWGGRLLRQRERTWLTLWGLERGVCLARGRIWSIPVTPLIRFCDNWHESDIAAPWDDSISPSMVLRRDLLPFIERLKADLIAKASQSPPADSTLKTHEEIELYFLNWMESCPIVMTHDAKERKLPPYIEVLTSHTRLSAYAHLINLPTASMAIRKQFRAAAFSAALCVLRTVVQREAELTMIPNNSVIMIAFSAVFTINITPFSERGTSSFTSSVLTLINEVIGVLERIGNVTKHRNGISALFAVHLRHIVQLASSAMASTHLEELPETDEAAEIRPGEDSRGQSQDSTSTVGPSAAEQLVDFSDLSTDQITDLINSMGDCLDEYDWDFHMGSFPDPNFMDWGHLA